MVALQKFKVYEYPTTNGEGVEYMGSYTIKEGVKPLARKGEILVDEFETEVLVKE